MLFCFCFGWWCCFDQLRISERATLLNSFYYVMVKTDVITWICLVLRTQNRIMLTSSRNSERTWICSQIYFHCFQLQILLFEQTVASFPWNIYRFNLILNHSGNMFDSFLFIWGLHQRMCMTYLKFTLAVLGIVVMLGRLLFHFTLQSHLQIRALRRIPHVLWSRSYAIASKLKSCSSFWILVHVLLSFLVTQIWAFILAYSR